MSEPLLLIAVLIGSVVIHELAHGVVALCLGDPTAKLAGRLTLNPVKHLDPVGSVIMPAFLAFAGGPVFGWAKPVPVSPHKLKGTDRTGFAIVALAGPASNVILAFTSIVVLRTVYNVPPELIRLGALPPGLGPRLLYMFFLINILLAAFNLMPIPPLDGSRMLRLFLTPGGRQALDKIEPFGILIVLGLLLWMSDPFFRIIQLIANALLRLIPL